MKYITSSRFQTFLYARRELTFSFSLYHFVIKANPFPFPAFDTYFHLYVHNLLLQNKRIKICVRFFCEIAARRINLHPLPLSWFLSHYLFFISWHFLGNHLSMSLSGGFHVLHNLLNYNCSWNICQLYLWIYLNVFSQFFRNSEEK